MDRSLLARDTFLFIRLTDQLADWFVRSAVTCSVGDACEGYNSANTHGS